MCCRILRSWRDWRRIWNLIVRWFCRSTKLLSGSRLITQWFLLLQLLSSSRKNLPTYFLWRFHVCCVTLKMWRLIMWLLLFYYCWRSNFLCTFISRLNHMLLLLAWDSALASDYICVHVWGSTTNWHCWYIRWYLKALLHTWCLLIVPRLLLAVLVEAFCVSTPIVWNSLSDICKWAELVCILNLLLLCFDYHGITQ